jgi:hypothetical protein
MKRTGRNLDIKYCHTRLYRTYHQIRSEPQILKTRDSTLIEKLRLHLSRDVAVNHLY